MTTRRKRWPNHAEAARMDCVSLSRKGRRALVGELERVNDAALLCRMAQAIEAFREIEAKLIACKDESETKE